MFTTLISSCFKRYRLAAVFDGHRDAIFSLAIAKSGRYFSSGGIDGAKVWDMKTYKEVKTPEQFREYRGQVVCMSWVTLPNDKNETLCFATGLGYLVFWEQNTERKFDEIFSHRVANGAEVTCLATSISEDGLSIRIALGARDKAIQVWTLDHMRHIVCLLSVALETTVPVSIEIARNVTRDIRVFGLYDGSVRVLSGGEGKQISNKVIGSAIGGASSCERDDLVIVDNLTSGFSLHKLSDGAYIRGYPTQASGRSFIKAVAFVEDSRVIVGGSDHGIVYLFDRDSGAAIDTLRHTDRGLVQTVATYQQEGSNLVVCASSETSQAGRISVWVRKTSRGRDSPGLSIGSTIQLIWQIMMIVAILGILFPFLRVDLERSEISEWAAFARLKASEHTTRWVYTTTDGGKDRQRKIEEQAAERGAELKSEMAALQGMMQQLIMQVQAREREPERLRRHTDRGAQQELVLVSELQ